MTDRSILKLARAEYLRRASMLNSPEADTTPEEPPASRPRKRARMHAPRSEKSVARRQAKRLLARNERVPVQLLRVGWPEGKSRKPEVQQLLESTGLAASTKAGPVRRTKKR